MNEAVRTLHAPAHPATQLDLARWNAAQTLDEYIAEDIRNHELWRTTTRLAKLPAEFAERCAAIASESRLLVLLEDWCGDAMYTVPFVQRITDANPLVSLRVLTRDANEDLMATHLTGASRSIPVVMRFDARGTETGWWGPRPAPLQEWVLTEGVAMEKPERYKGVRTWYARDRGRTTVSELLQLLGA